MPFDGEGRAGGGGRPGGGPFAGRFRCDPGADVAYAHRAVSGGYFFSISCVPVPPFCYCEVPPETAFAYVRRVVITEIMFCPNFSVFLGGQGSFFLYFVFPFDLFSCLFSKRRNLSFSFFFCPLLNFLVLGRVSPFSSFFF